MQLKEEEYADKLHQLSFKYEEQIKTLMRKNQEADNSAELKSYEYSMQPIFKIILWYFCWTLSPLFGKIWEGFREISV